MKKVLLFLLYFVFICFLACRVLAADQVEINTASLQQLDEIIGIGPVLAQRIIDARPFSSVDDLLRVKGIGPKTLQKIKDQGLAYVSGQAQQPVQEIAPTPAPTPTPATSPAPTPAITSPSGVFINEILPNPEGADETDEWIELYNSNNFDVDLSGWHLQDQQGTITTFTIPSGVKILANNFLVFKRPDTKIMLNNDTDGLNLLTPDEKTEDTMSFTTAPLNQSYNKTNSGWVWSSTLTPGTTNIITAVQSATQAKNNSATLSKTQKNDNNKITTAATADLSQTINTNQDDAQNNSPWILFFAALAITIILSSIVLFIKLKFKKNVGT